MSTTAPASGESGVRKSATALPFGRGARNEHGAERLQWRSPSTNPVWLRQTLQTLALTLAVGLSLGHHKAVFANDNESIEETPIDSFDRGHWAYQPITQQVIPTVQQSDWPRTPIDHFVLAEMENRQLTPAPVADRATLLRRLSYDLTGLPPTTRQLSNFVADDRPDAYRRLVDSLLASPEYGRRWGQYWLDLARFAETDGFEHDKVRPTAWQYRDWVIAAFSQDLPYDQFLTLQLAGDVVQPDDPSSVVATSFVLSGPDMPDINSQEERKHVLLNEVTSTVGSALFSLQIGCAQCHDHKYDPISQADFYRLRAFFDPSVKLQRNKSVTTLDHRADPDAVSRLMVRGDWRRPSAELQSDFPRIANPFDDEVRSEQPGERRLELARWLTEPTNPLTARSIVNRVWQHHFGKGLSTTPSDFGVMGEEPSHGELLDYLAHDLITDGWSLKRLHRQIVLSAVYRTRSRPPHDATQRTDWRTASEVDPSNRWLSRFPRRRLDAESIRDSLLACSGSLVGEAGGPGVMPPLPKEMLGTLLKGQWKTSPRRADHYRRSIYVFARRNLRYPMFATFDRPAANGSCAVRHTSTTAVQSLLLLNSKITLDAAQRLAKKVSGQQGDPPAICREVYRRVLSRDPDPVELQDCVEFLSEQSRLLRNEGHDQPAFAALTDLCRAIFNSNQFLYVD